MKDNSHTILWGPLLQHVGDTTDLLRALSISMVTRMERAMVMGWRSSNTLQEDRPTKSGFSAVHFKWWL